MECSGAFDQDFDGSLCDDSTLLWSVQMTSLHLEHRLHPQRNVRLFVLLAQAHAGAGTAAGGGRRAGRLIACCLWPRTGEYRGVPCVRILVRFWYLRRCHVRLQLCARGRQPTLVRTCVLAVDSQSLHLSSVLSTLQ